MTIKHLELCAASVLTGTAATKYTTPTATNTQIRQVTALNTTAAPVTLQVYVVPLAGTAAVGNQLVSFSVPAGGSYLCPELIGKIMAAGSFMQALGTGLTFTASGAEIS
jgi:hypothetical protein